MRPELSVVICTHNRAPDAGECLQRLVEQPGGAELPVLLVDSGSDPAHRDALKELSGAHENVRFERVEQPGLSAARNRGIACSDSDWIAFLDDDAVPAPNWIERARCVTRAAEAGVAVIGGRILPRWPADRPSHVGPRWLMFLSCIEATSQEGRGADPICYGANLMVRRSALERVGGFDLSLGRDGTKLLSGEETLLFASVRAWGGRLIYDPDLVVEHKIGAERLTRAWIKRRAYWGGVTELELARRTKESAWHLHPAKVLASVPPLFLLSRLHDPNSDRYIRLWYALGVLGASTAGVPGRALRRAYELLLGRDRPTAN